MKLYKKGIREALHFMEKRKGYYICSQVTDSLMLTRRKHCMRCHMQQWIDLMDRPFQGVSDSGDVLVIDGNEVLTFTSAGRCSFQKNDQKIFYMPGRDDMLISNRKNLRRLRKSYGLIYN